MTRDYGRLRGLLASRWRLLRQARDVRSMRLLTKSAFFVALAAWTALFGAAEFVRVVFGANAQSARVVVTAGVAVVVTGAVAGWRYPAGTSQTRAAAMVGSIALYAAAIATSQRVATLCLLTALAALGRTAGASWRSAGAVVPATQRRVSMAWTFAASVLALPLTAPLVARATFEGSRFVVYLAAVSAAIGAWCQHVFLRAAAADLEQADARDLAVRARAAMPADAERPLLEVRDLEVWYGSVQVLFGAHLDVRAGELVALLGTNGAGKSTVLKAIAGFVQPRAGSITFDGDDVAGLLPEEIAELGVILVPGGRAVFPDLTVVENLRMGAFLCHDESHVSTTTDRIYELFPRLAERRRSLAGTLSGGEQQMLAIAQALYHEPRVLLIDELSLGLAPSIVADLLDVVRDLAAQGTAVVLVEQSVNVALSVVERAVFMEKGEVRYTGPARDLLHRPDIVRSVFLEGATNALAKEAVMSR